MAKAFLRSVRAARRKALLADLSSIARREIEDAMDKRIKPALVKSHEKIVEDWESDVGFAARKVVKPDSIAVYVFPTGKDKLIWIYVDQGTKRHDIEAKNAPRLAFWMTTQGGKPVRGKYEPKTRARPARTVAGGGYVPEPKTFLRPLVVDHPGNEPRNFTAAIARDIEPFFIKEIENAFRRAARKVAK